MYPYSATTYAQARELLRLPDARLFESASCLREARFGRTVELCAIINARSGNCGMDCSFCSQSRHNHTAITRFDFLSEATLRQRILTLAALPVSRIGIVTSGAALSNAELECLATVLSSLPPDIVARCCASLGRVSAIQLERLTKAGLRRYHHNLETAQSYYPCICTTQNWGDRRDTVLRAMSGGFSVCSGGLFGLGESWEDRIDFAFSLKALGVHHVPMNFLHPHSGTPLAGRVPLSADEALRIIALFRHILPDASLRVCGGRPLTFGDRQQEIFAAGADALMTGDYLTTRGNGIEADLGILARLGLVSRFSGSGNTGSTLA